jgi:hypothetical protein
MRARPTSAAVLVLAVVGMICGSGCGGQDGYRVSGTVTFADNPVPAGMIYFEPDSTRGNSGPTGFAPIKDGRFDTAAQGRSRGTNGGPQRVRIDGHEPSPAGEFAETGGRRLFEGYSVFVDLPKAASIHNFDVPGDVIEPSRQ